jgi:hypothetical protein
MNNLDRLARVCALVALIALEPQALARFDPVKVYREAPAIAAKFPDPVIEIVTPCVRAGQAGFHEPRGDAGIHRCAREKVRRSTRASARQYARGPRAAAARARAAGARAS